jgi:asparagine synthase (glutamine-hydrolysing)
MCGIAGLLTFDSAHSHQQLHHIAEAMNKSLQHRGPDDQGIWVDDDAPIALTHRRLSIVDLSPAGHQPMTSADGRYVITYNGEIYNYEEMRPELAAPRHRIPRPFRH